MTWWPFLPAIAAYLVVAWLVWKFGLSLVGDSPAGQSAAPVVGALWLPTIFVLVLVAIVALVDAAFEYATVWMRAPENRG